MTPVVLKHFLLVFDPASGREADVTEFTDNEAALDAYGDAERLFRGRPGVQVVLIGADSLATVKKTHSNYFDDSAIRAIQDELRRRTAV